MSRILKAGILGVLLLWTVYVVVAVLLIVRANSPADVIVAPPFALWGLPIAKLVFNVCLATVIGALTLACWAIPKSSAAYERTLHIAASSATVMTLASATVGLSSYVSLANTSVSSSPDFTQSFMHFLLTISLGQAWLFVTCVSALVSVLCFALRNQTGILFVGAFSLTIIIAIAQQGHSSQLAAHDMAVTSYGLHVLFMSIWTGGLFVLIAIKSRIEHDLFVSILKRYSTLALIAFLVVIVSGVANGLVRVESVDELWTPYGFLLIGKTFLFGGLGLAGALHRTWAIGRLHKSENDRFFYTLLFGELVIMMTIIALAVVLGRTSPPLAPLPNAMLTPAEILTGEALPAEMLWSNMFVQWRFDLLWLLIGLFGAFFYVAGVYRLKQRGDAWSLLRTSSWLVGMAMLIFVTSGIVNVYERYLFSAHMLAHMMLSMMVPLFLVLGAPVTLGMRAIRKRTDGSRGSREWIMIAVHSKYASIISHPIVAAVVFALSLWIFYYTSVFRWVTMEHLGHVWMTVHFLMAGYLFVQALIGIDPVAYRLPYPFRLVLLLATMAFHAFFGLALMQGSGLLLADWYGAMGRTWGAAPLIDQQNGGAIAWAIGELPTVALAIIVAIQWRTHDEREAKRRDRHEERTGYAELAAYNETLNTLAKHDRRRDLVR